MSGASPLVNSPPYPAETCCKPGRFGGTMPHMNEVFLIGHVGKDADVRVSPSGVKVTKFSLATTRKWKAKDGTPKEQTQWHNITCFGHTATDASLILKGDTVMVVGSISYGSWEKDGVKKYRTDIMAEHVFVRPSMRVVEEAKQEFGGEFVDFKPEQPVSTELPADFIVDDQRPVSVDDLPF